MTNLFTLLVVSLLSVGAQAANIKGGGAIGVSEYIDYNAYQAKFRVPADAKNIQIQHLFVQKIDIGRTETWVPGCTETVDGGPAECIDYKVKSEKALQTLVTFESQLSYPGTVDSNDYNEVVANFRLTDMSPEKVAAIPKVNFFGKGSKENRQFARENINLVATDETVTEWHVDNEKSVFCPTDGEGNKLDYTCEDQIVTKPVEVPARFVELTVKN